MQIMSAEASSAFTRRVIMPLAALVASLLLCAIGGVFLIAEYQTTIAIREQGKLARNGLSMISERLETGIKDYGRWDEALAAATGVPDRDWLQKNIGEAGENSFHTEGVFVLDANGGTVYSRIRGIDGTRSIADALPPEFSAWWQRWRNTPPYATFTGILPFQGRAAAYAISPLRPFEDSAPLKPTGYSLVFIDVLDGGELKQFDHDFGLVGFSAIGNDAALADRRASIEVAMPEGAGSFRFAWVPVRPGDDLLKIAIPFLLVFVPILTALGIVLLRYVILSVQVISDREKKAFTDPLTELPNRAGFFRRLGQALRDQAGSGAQVAVMYVDLDGFKHVNDTMGHGAGDHLLIEAGARFRACVGDMGVVARLGGDEFAVVFPDGSDRARLQATGARMLIALNEPFHLPEGAAHASCSIGIAQAPQEGIDADDLMSLADHALYEAKSSGKNALRFASPLPVPPVLRRIA